mmetsp:Transcript_53480/g.95150  ORF Transcript_53480/g.95150 Transcript_53480/m.95150 type:complete len:186 (+) Transcript_53480:29-586(+)
MRIYNMQSAKQCPNLFRQPSDALHVSQKAGWQALWLQSKTWKLDTQTFQSTRGRLQLQLSYASLPKFVGSGAGATLAGSGLAGSGAGVALPASGSAALELDHPSSALADPKPDPDPIIAAESSINFSSSASSFIPAIFDSSIISALDGPSSETTFDLKSDMSDTGTGSSSSQMLPSKYQPLFNRK